MSKQKGAAMSLNKSIKFYKTATIVPPVIHEHRFYRANPGQEPAEFKCDECGEKM
jgi:hypothetical protein